MQVLTRVDRPAVRHLVDRDEFFWLDLVDPTDEDLAVVGAELGLHPLALEDTREFGQRPKLERYEGAVLLVFGSARLTPEDDPRTYEPVEVHLHISGSFVVTARRTPCAALDALHELHVPDDAAGEDYLVYRILDGLTDAFYPVLAAIEDRIDGLEAEVFLRPRGEQLSRVYRLRQEVHALLRTVHPQRVEFGESSAAILELPGLTRSAREYLRDVGDHLNQIEGEFGRQTDDLHALTSIYFAANTNRLTALATRLSVLATAFFVLTLVTSFFGQNFGWLVEKIDTRTDFLVFGVGALVLPGLILSAIYWRKRRDWT